MKLQVRKIYYDNGNLLCKQHIIKFSLSGMSEFYNINGKTLNETLHIK